MVKWFKFSWIIVLSIVVLTACEQKRPHNDKILGLPENMGFDPDLRPTGMTYKNLRQHTFSRSGEDYDPVISRDGKMVIFASTRHTLHPDIYIKPINGPIVTQKTRDSSSDLQPTFSPNGENFAFTSNRNGNWDIFVMKTHSRSTPLQVTRSSADEIHPHWSPDGTQLVYCAFSETSNQWEIWVHDFVTQEASVLGVGLFPQWSPNGKHIVYQKARHRGTRWYSVWQMDKKGDNVTEIIADNDWAAINPSYSPDGSKIVFATVFKSTHSKMKKRFLDGDDIWMINVDGTNLIRLTTHDQADWNPSWGPDGRVYFTSKRDGYTNVWSAEPISIDFVPDMRRRTEDALDPMMPKQADQAEMNQGSGSKMDSVTPPQKMQRH